MLLVGLVLVDVAQAADRSAAVVGSSYAAIMARTSNVHISSASYDRCTGDRIVRTGGGGTRLVAPPEGGWLCVLSGTLYLTFKGTTACAAAALVPGGSPGQCAKVETLRFMQHNKQALSPSQVAWLWLQVLRTAYWAATEVQEFEYWCIADADCQYTVGDGICSLDSQCTNDLPQDMLNLDYWDGLYESTGSGTAQDYVGYYEWTLANHVGDAGEFWGGSWGVMIDGSDTGYFLPCMPQNGCN
jgi:hypothetical protein